MLKRFAISFFFALFACASTLAHIGSPNVFFEGDAGPYPIRVMIRPPRVVPGLAEISVRVKTNGVSKISVLPARWDTGRKGAPPPDLATPVKGETNLYTSQLWLMNSGAYSVFVNVEGAAGPATAIVPVNSLALTRLDMPRWMSGLFLTLGLALFVSLAAVVNAAVREGSLPAGQSITPARIKWGRIACVVAVVIASGLLALGKGWWDVVDRDFQKRRLYKTVVVKTEIQNGALTLRPPEKGESRADWTPLVPEHSKMMHLFLIQEKTGQAFAHLHPTRHGNFRAALPPLPSGAYQIYADVTHESGLTETWISKIELSAAISPTQSDPDDAFTVAAPGDRKVSFPNGPTIIWEPDPIPKANAETTLRFTVRNADDSRAELQPYLGMYAHAVIWKDDGKVFTHLHPLGTISMTSQLLFARRENGERLANAPLDIVCGAPPKEVSFPYAFPEPGHYRIWVQVRTAGAIHTAPFQLDVD